MKAQPDSTSETFGRRRSRWGRRLRIGLLVVAFPVVVFLLEDWRGRRAWEECKRELAAKGEAVEWSAILPAPVPDEENFFKAPKMADWFGVRVNWFREQPENELLNRFSRVPFEEYVGRQRTNAVAEVSVVSSVAFADLKEVDLVLQYNCRVLSLAVPHKTTATSYWSLSPIPLIQFEEVPLIVAIQNLARQADLNYLLDPKVTAAWLGPDGEKREPIVSIRWENVTARQALFALLKAYGLIWIEDPEIDIARIAFLEPGDASSYVVPNAGERLLELTRSALLQRLAAVPGPHLAGSQRYTFVAGQLPDARPRRVVVLSEEPLDTNTVSGFFPGSLGPGLSCGDRWQAENNGSNSFLIFRNREPAYPAADYLAWSDRFQPEFDQVRAALQRPGVYLEDDYEKAGPMPMRNYSGLRYGSQILSQRAQCHLLLGRPGDALRELTLSHELRRVLSAKPVTLVAAMVDVALAGVYVETLADGLRLQAWTEPELVALQRQLGSINLLPVLKAGLRTERAALCDTLQIIKANQFAGFFDVIGWPHDPTPSWWKRNTDPAFLLLKFAPRGWMFQNLAVIARAEQFSVEIINLDHQLVEPAKAAAAAGEVESLGKNRGPYTLLARRATPNFLRAASVLARNQTMVNQALIACGLERYRCAHGEFPETLDALIPKFLEKLPHDIIGGQPLKYQRTADGKFTLYSIGWNEMDEGGKLAYYQDGSVNYDSPDWVWDSTSQ